MLAYVFERFPKYSQTFCYREVAELFRQGVRLAIFSLRAPEPGEEQEWSPEILSRVQQLPEGDAFAQLADEAKSQLSGQARKVLRAWRGRRDSLRLHQAVYIGARLRDLGVRHVHVHFAGMAARTAFWIREFFDIPYSVTVHANDIFRPNEYEVGLEEIFNSASAVVAVSDFAARYLGEKFPVPAKKVHRIYNGIDLHGFKPSQFEQPPLVLSIGRLINKKGFDVVIDACGLLGKTDFRCEIVGEGPLRRELQAQIERRDLAGRVSLAGAKAQKQIAGRLSCATAFALPCRVETDGARDNLPTVIMEAMAAALPVISTDVGGVSEMVRDGQTGFLAQQNDPSSTAEALARLLRDKELARELGRRGRQRCADMFSIERNVRALRELIL